MSNKERIEFLEMKIALLESQLELERLKDKTVYAPYEPITPWYPTYPTYTGYPHTTTSDGTTTT